MSDALVRVTVHIDGGSRGNPGPAAVGVVINSADDGRVLHEAGIFIGNATNNVAEYRALLAGLDAAADLGAEELEIISDSQLLVRQMTGQYRVKNAGLKDLHALALTAARKFRRCMYRHVRREENVHADSLVNQAINLRRNVADAAG